MPDRPSSRFGELRVMTDTALEMVLGWRNHPAIRANMFSQHEITWDEHRNWWDRVKASSNMRCFIHERDGQSTGYVAFSEIAPRSATATWGFFASPDAPKGSGSLMTFLALDMAFGPLGLRKLNAEVLGRNDISLRLHDSFGFQREGLFRDHVKIGDALDDVHRLALFDRNWAGLRAAKLKILTERLSQ